MAVSQPYPGTAEPGNVYPGVPSTVIVGDEEWEYVSDSEIVAGVREAAGKNAYSATVYNTVPGATHEVEIGGMELAYAGKFFTGDQNLPEHTVEWFGTPNDSVTTLHGEGVEYASYSSALANARKTSEWSSTGDHSIVLETRQGQGYEFPSSATLELSNIVANQEYTFRATVRIEKNQDLPVSLSILSENLEISDKAGTYEVSLTFKSATDLAKTNARIWLWGNYDSGRVWIDNVALQKGIAAGYFSGDAESDADVVYSWAGVPNNSESIRTSVANLSSYEGEHCVVVQSSLWSTEGDKSVRLINTDATSPGRAKIIDLSELVMGKTYTVSGVVMSREGTATTGYPYRALALETNLEPLHNSAKSNIGAERVLFTFTVLPEMTEGGIYIYNGGIQGDPDVWWDELILSDGTAVEPYFDGSYPGHEWLGEPHMSVSRRIPVAYRTGGWPLKKYLSSMADRLGEVDELVARLTYLPKDQRDLATLFGYSNEGRTVPIGATADLVDPRTANPEWLPWIAQLMGVNIEPYATNEDLRVALINSKAGGNSGTREAIASVVRGQLSGPDSGKEVRLYSNSKSIATIGEDSGWDVLIVTPEGISPSTEVIMNAIEAARVKPAGIKLHHVIKSTTWAELSANLPTWAEWKDKTWRDIETIGY